MTRSIKILPLIFFLSFVYAHSMERAILNQSCLRNSKEEITPHTPQLLLKLPDEILGSIVKYATFNDPFNTITLLIQISSVCKEFEHLRMPKKIKTILNLDQKMLDDSLHIHAFLNNDCNHNFTPFFKVLIAMGANINRYCKTLTSCVSHTTNIYIVEHFIAHGANINHQDKDGLTPLRWAIDLNRPDIVRVLLEHNANIYLSDKNGKTPTDMALLSGKVECLKALIEHGIDTTIEYSRGENCKLTIAEWAKLYATTSDKNNADIYREIYKLATGKEIPKSWYEKSGSELLKDACVIS